MRIILGAVLFLFSLLSPMSVEAKPPAPFLPWWYQAPPVIPAWYYQRQCQIAYWYLVERTSVDSFGNPITWLAYEPYWACN